MEIKETKKDTKNTLLKRRELVFVVSTEEGNPGFEKTKKLVADEFKVEEDKIAIKKIGSEFGKNDFIIEVFIYDTKEDLIALEPKSKKVEAKA